MAVVRSRRTSPLQSTSVLGAASGLPLLALSLLTLNSGSVTAAPAAATGSTAGVSTPAPNGTPTTPGAAAATPAASPGAPGAGSASPGAPPTSRSRTITAPSPLTPAATPTTQAAPIPSAQPGTAAPAPKPAMQPKPNPAAPAPTASPAAASPATGPAPRPNPASPSAPAGGPVVKPSTGSAPVVGTPAPANGPSGKPSTNPGGTSPAPAAGSPARPGAPAPAAAEPFLPPGSPVPGTPATPRTPATQPAPSNEPRVLVSEVVIQGLDGHPERQRLEQAAYGAMGVTPGSEVTRSQLRDDLAAIYATGWFSDVRIQPKDSPLGVKLVVVVSPNPVLRKLTLDPADAKVPAQVVQDTFAAEYGRTLNLNTLQSRMQDLQKWYSDQGYSLARVSGPTRVSPDGEVVLQVRQGIVQGVDVQFLNKEGSATNDKGQPIKGKTKTWVITREISLKPGQVFNRRDLEDDLKRLYGTGLFSDVKVTLKPVADDPGRITIVLGIVEQSTGSLSGGLGYSQSQGVFGQVQLQDNNFTGRAYDLSTSFTFGQFGGLADLTFTDPWIRGDRYRTAMRIKAFISREAPQIFQSYANAFGQSYGNIATVAGFYQAPATSVAYNVGLLPIPTLAYATTLNQALGAAGLSWFQYDGNAVLVQRVGGNIQFVRPLNGGNPFKRAKWGVVVGLSAQEVTPMNTAGQTMVYGMPTNTYAINPFEVPLSQIICLSYNCATSNQLVGVRFAATYNTLNDARNPTQGNFVSLSTEQFVSVGPNSPNFNRLRAGYTHYIPVNWLRFYKGCRPKAGEAPDCKQALAFQMMAGTVIGGLPPYEAFCLGGGNSVRGFYDCNLGVGRSFGEATIEYRFPLFSIISGEIFIDAGTTFGSQSSVPGNPGGLLGKPGSGFSIGTGVIVTTPVGPLRLEVASQDTAGWRFNLGVGWKF